MIGNKPGDDEKWQDAFKRLVPKRVTPNVLWYNERDYKIQNYLKDILLVKIKSLRKLHGHEHFDSRDPIDNLLDNCYGDIEYHAEQLCTLFAMINKGNNLKKLEWCVFKLGAFEKELGDYQKHKEKELLHLQKAMEARKARVDLLKEQRARMEYLQKKYKLGIHANKLTNDNDDIKEEISCHDCGEIINVIHGVAKHECKKGPSVNNQQQGFIYRCIVCGDHLLDLEQKFFVCDYCFQYDN